MLGTLPSNGAASGTITPASLPLPAAPAVAASAPGSPAIPAMPPVDPPVDEPPADDDPAPPEAAVLTPAPPPWSVDDAPALPEVPPEAGASSATEHPAAAAIVSTMVHADHKVIRALLFIEVVKLRSSMRSLDGFDD